MFSGAILEITDIRSAHSSLTRTSQHGPNLTVREAGKHTQEHKDVCAHDSPQLVSIIGPEVEELNRQEIGWKRQPVVLVLYEKQQLGTVSQNLSLRFFFPGPPSRLCKTVLVCPRAKGPRDEGKGATPCVAILS